MNNEYFSFVHPYSSSYNQGCGGDFFYSTPPSEAKFCVRGAYIRTRVFLVKFPSENVKRSPPEENFGQAIPPP